MKFDGKNLFSGGRMRKILAIILILLFGCMTTQKKIEKPLTPEKEEKKEVQKFFEAYSIKELRSLITKSPFYQEGEKILFFSSGKETAKKVKQKLMKQFSKSLSTEEIGLSNANKESIIFQLDSRNIPLFVALDSEKEEEIVLEVYSVETGEKETFRVDCTFLKEEKLDLELVMDVSFEPKSASFSYGEVIIFSDGKKIEVLDLVEKTERTIDSLLCEEILISNFGEGAVSFCPSSGKGANFVRKNGKWEVNERVGFPLPEKVLRFVSVQKDDNDSWALFDRKEDILGEFLQLSKFTFNETTILLALTEEGEIWGLRGDLILPIYPKEKMVFKKIDSFDNLAFALSSQGELYRITLDEDFSINFTKEKIAIYEKIVEIAVGEKEVYLFSKGEEKIKLYKVPIYGE